MPSPSQAAIKGHAMQSCDSTGNGWHGRGHAPNPRPVAKVNGEKFVKTGGFTGKTLDVLLCSNVKHLLVLKRTPGCYPGFRTAWWKSEIFKKGMPSDPGCLPELLARSAARASRTCKKTRQAVPFKVIGLTSPPAFSSTIPSTAPDSPCPSTLSSPGRSAR